MKKPKTRLEWLNELPEPYRSQGIKNTKKQRDDYQQAFMEEETTLWGAIAGAFEWGKSKEGINYWSEITHDGLPEPTEPASWYD